MTGAAHFEAARRLTSAFTSGHVDNFLDIVEEVDAVGGWKAVALALNGDVASLAIQVHGDQTQHWLDSRIASQLDREAARQNE